MKISIVTVLFNAEKTILDTLSSVRAQSYEDYEHILIDGGSKDRSLAIVDAHRHPKLKIISEPDDGLYDAMNKGVRLATGDLIGFLNADDFFCRTDALHRIAEAAAANSRAAAVSAGVAVVAHDQPDRIRRIYRATGFHPWMLRFGHMPPHPGFYARRSALSAVGNFATNLQIASDFEWMVRFYCKRHLTSVPVAQLIVAMRDRGVSSRGLKSTRVLNSEAYRALIMHRVWTAAPLIWSKYFIKIGQMVAVSESYPAAASVRWMPGAGGVYGERA
jgi:glycosyltransferase involved in cell wall biosynthesis